jgi:ABC-type Fe3+-siderophore transport system permease subunit
MRADRTDKSLAQHAVLAVSMIGVALVFILNGRDPGWQPFLASVILALGFLIVTLLAWKRREWLAVLALAVLLLSVFWDRERPFDVVFGVVIVVISVLNAQGSVSGDEAAASQPREVLLDTEAGHDDQG